MKIVLATSNAGKVKELSALLAARQIKVIAQSEFDFVDAKETGLTFVENAILKARHACQHTGLPAIADDSGIEVDALRGQPGIYSARYAGENSSSEDNIDKLLSALVGATTRTARFRCVMVFLRHELDPSPVIGEGSWAGEILEKRSGEGGFGYDPIFYVPEYNCSAAELAKEQKNRISHRAQALQKLLSAF